MKLNLMKPGNQKQNMEAVQINTLFNYWGKADDKYPGEPKWHPLAYHSLDVAAVAASWWDTSPAIRRTFLAAFNY